MIIRSFTLTLALLFTCHNLFGIGAPTHVSPTNGGTNISPSIILDWSTVSGNTGYLYQIDVSPSFNSPQLIAGNTPINSSQVTSPPLLYGTTYYWRVATTGPVDTSAWTAAWSFTTYNTVTLVDPINGGINYTINPLLDWTTASGSTNYLYQVDITNTFNSPSLINGNTGSTSSQANVSNLLYGTTYFWRVRAVNAVDTTNWSTTWSFTTYDNISLVDPINGGVNYTINPLLDWTTASGSTNYQYQVDVVNTFSSPSLINANTGSTSSQANVSNLLYGTTYFWRVRGISPVDTTQWSATWSFTTYNNISLVDPINGGVNYTINPLLDWTTASGSTNYQYQVDVVNTFSSPSLINANTGSTSSQANVSNLLYGTTYFWRVRGISPVDTTNWSPTWSFTTYNNISLVDPINGGVNYTINPLLDWTTASGSTNYQYQVDVVNTFSSPSLINANTGSTSSQANVSNLLYGTTYFWRVRGISPVDTTNWSPTWSFSTYDAVTLVSPINGAINQAVNPLLDWSTATGSTNYLYQVDVVNTFNSPSLINGNTGSTSSQANLSSLDFGTTYYWRVRAVSPVDTTQWSATWSFSTLANAVHVSPTNGAINQPINPTLDWSTVSGSISYTYQYDVTNTFSSPALVTNTISSASSQVTLNNLMYGTTYYWRVSVTTSAGTTGWTTPWSFTTYDGISLVSPINGAINQSVNPTLDWAAGSGTSYIYQVDQSNTFNSPSLVTGNVTSSQVTLNDLYYGTTYYWRVRVVSPVDTTQWSATWAFTTYDQLSLVSPVNGAINQAINPTIDWSVGSGTAYLYEVDVTNTFNSPALISGNTVSSQATLSNLLYGTQYFWRVRAINSVDTSLWSSTWSFNTYDQLSLVSPINGAVNQSVNPTIDWSVGSGTSYLYEVDLTNTFNSPALISGNTVSSQATLGDLLYGTTYFWRVRAVSPIDTTQWSATWSFTTYDQLSLVSPINGAINQAINPTIDWSTGSGTGYLYEVDVTNSFNSPSLMTASAVSSQASLAGLLYGTQYFWRVRALNAVDTSSYSAVWSFTTVFQLSTPPTLISPVNGATAIPSNGQNFTWNSVATATGYTLEYSQNSTFSSGVQSVNTTGTSTIINGLMANTTYYWRVRASNASGSSGWSVTWSFTTSNCFVSSSLTASSCTSYLFNGNTLTSSGTYTANLIASSGCDSIVTLNLTILTNTASTLNIVECVSYTVPSGNATYTTSGVYSDVIPNAAGCDSLITINLTIPVINTNVQLSGITLTSNEVGATYQWINCAGNVPIAGATSQSFTPTANGDYAVIVTKNGCSATSSCTTISTIGLSETSIDFNVNISPNPSTGVFNVSLTDPSKVKSMMVLNALGQQISESTLVQTNQPVLLDGPAGIYLLLFTLENGQQIPYKVVKYE